MGVFFNYHAKDKEGKYYDGSIEAMNENEALDNLEKQGLTVVTLKPAEPENPAPQPQMQSPSQPITHVKCSFCQELMSIDATVCPHCHRQGGGYKYVRAYIGGLIGVIVSIFIMYIMSGGTSFIAATFCGGCLLNPIAWVCMIVGVGVGYVMDEIQKNKLKNPRPKQ